MRSYPHDGHPVALGRNAKAGAEASAIQALGTAMHRPHPPLTRALVVLALALFFPGLAAGQLRTIPEAAKRATIEHVTDMIVSVDGRQMRLAPGAAIRNERNLIIVPVALPRAGAEAHYLVDADGQISRVWLLSAEEAARPAKREASR